MANVVRLIDANALEKRMEERLNSLRKAYGNHDHYTDGFEEGCVAVEYAETIDPVILIPKARWIIDDKGVAYCGRCRHIDDYASVHNYCPYCGAKMEG